MTLSAADIELAYALFLGRPAAPAEIEAMQTHAPTLEAMRELFLGSHELHRTVSARAATREAARRYGGKNGIPNAPHRALIHLHIPKTGGTALTTLLASGRKRVSPKHPVAVPVMALQPRDVATFPLLPEETRADLELIFGHMAYGLHVHLPQETGYLTLLRTPGARLFSYFRFILRREDHPFHARLAPHRPSFGTFLKMAAEDPEMRVEADNAQIRYLAGNIGVDGVGQEEALLAQALSHVMSDRVLYGLTEDLAGFRARLLAHGLLEESAELPDPDPRKRDANAAPGPQSTAQGLAEAEEAFDAEERALFEAFTSWDAYLYTICRDIYYA